MTNILCKACFSPSLCVFHPGRGASTAPLRSPAAAGARPGGRPGGRVAPAAAGRGQRVGGGPVRATWLALVPPLPAAGLGNQPVLPRGARGAHGAGAGAPPAATGTRPAGAGTGGPPGGGKGALGMAGAGQTGVRSAAGAREALAARPEVGTAAAGPAGALARPRRGARVPTCAQSEPAAPGSDRCPPPSFPTRDSRTGAAGCFLRHFGCPVGTGGQATPPPLRSRTPPPPHRAGRAGRSGRAGCRGTGNGERCTAPGCITSTACSAQRTAPRQCTCPASTEHGTQYTTGCSTQCTTGCSAQCTTGCSTQSTTGCSTQHSAQCSTQCSTQHSTQCSAQHSEYSTQCTTGCSTQHSTQCKRNTQCSTQYSTQRSTQCSTQRNTQCGTQCSAQHSTQCSTQCSTRGTPGAGPGRPGPLRQATLFSMGLPVRQPPPTHRPPGAPDAVAPASPGGMSMPNLAHGRASSEET